MCDHVNYETMQCVDAEVDESIVVPYIRGLQNAIGTMPYRFV